MADEQEIRIKVTADTSTAERRLDSIADKTEELGEKADGAKAKWATLSSRLSSISPAFAKLSEGWKKASKEIDDSFGANTASAKLFKLGVIGALAGIALKAGQTAAKFAKETASMFDPQGYSRAAGQMQSSIRKLKTSIGSITAPIVNTLMKGIAKIADGLTWIFEKIRVGVSYIQGFLQPVIDAVGDAFWRIVNAIKSAVNTLAMFLGFDAVFKTTEQAAQKTADAMGEITNATSAGLASFDKLNTLNMDNAGDAEEAEKINESIAEAKKNGEDMFSGLENALARLDLKNRVTSFITGIPGELGGAFSTIQTKLGEFFGGASTKMGELWDGFTQWGGDAWTTISETAGNVWTGITTFATTSWTSISSFAGSVWSEITTFATTSWSSITSFATSAWTSISEFAGSVWEGIKGLGTSVWTSITEFATSAWSVISSFATGVWSGIVSVATSVWDTIKTVALDVWSAISTPINALWGAFKSAGEWAWNSLKSIGESFKRIVIDPIANIVGWLLEKVEWIMDKLGGLKNTVSNFGGKIGNAVGGFVGGVKGILGFASGGVVAPNNPQPYILGDNKKDYEIVSPVPLMEQAVMSAISKLGGTGGGTASGPIELTVNLDGRRIARQIFDPLQTEARRRGTST